ncbi:MAG TPA: hypothetical protein VIM98_09410 [Dyella sp.]|uniref:hypothetical protein n=1 Tax=Dyella sp. TaxID=1869338 RepID=UPI002F927246
MTVRRWRAGWATVAGLSFAALYVVGRGDARRAWLAYLVAWMPILGIALGSLSLLMVHALTGGAWGRRLQPAFVSGALYLPAALLLALPLLIAAPSIFPWARQNAGKDWPFFYLNLPFFYARTLVCFACWLVWMRGILGRLRDASRPWPGFAAAGLVMMTVTVSLWATDWIMSQVRGWHSTALGVTVLSAQWLIALAFAIVRDARCNDTRCPPTLSRDLGSLLLVALLGWAYLGFVDFLTAWIADLPADTVWYLPRLTTSWRWLGTGIVILNFVPIVLLLFSAFKCNPRALARLAGALAVLQALYGFWLILPDVHPQGMTLGLVDPLAWIGVCAGAMLGHAAWRQRSWRSSE